MRGAAWVDATWVGIGVAMFGGVAHAHGLDADRIDVVLRGDTVEVVAAAPASFVAFADDDGDGRLERSEVRAHREEVRRVLADAIAVTDASGQPGEVTLFDVATPDGAGPNGSLGSDHLRLSFRVRWPEAPTAVHLRCAYAAARTITVVARRARPSETPGVLEWVGASEALRLGPDHAEATVLALPQAPVPVSIPNVPSPTHEGGSIESIRSNAAFQALCASALGLGLWLLGRHGRRRLGRRGLGWVGGRRRARHV